MGGTDVGAGGSVIGTTRRTRRRKVSAEAFGRVEAGGGNLVEELSLIHI